MTLRSIGLVAGALVLATFVWVGGDNEATAAAGCGVAASAQWMPAPGRTYRTEAFSNGQTCEQAVVTLVVRAPDGNVAWVDAVAGRHVMTFATVKTAQEMAGALSDWLSLKTVFRSTRALPAWAEGAEGPESGEFPFMPEPWMEREYYERVRAEALPLFCYIQGMESIACIMLSPDGVMEKIGVQSFPG